MFAYPQSIHADKAGMLLQSNVSEPGIVPSPSQHLSLERGGPEVQMAPTLFTFQRTIKSGCFPWIWVGGAHFVGY